MPIEADRWEGGTARRSLRGRSAVGAPLGAPKIFAASFPGDLDPEPRDTGLGKTPQEQNIARKALYWNLRYA
jgi:hypothetical protein